MLAELAAYAAALARNCVLSRAGTALQIATSRDDELWLREVTRSALALYDASRLVRKQHRSTYAVRPEQR